MTRFHSHPSARHPARLQGWTLMELLAVVTLMGILITFVSQEIFEIRKCSRGAGCGSALQAIETAKTLWRHDYPTGRNPTKLELTRYFANQRFPTDPWGIGFTAGVGGTIVTNDTDVIDLTQVATHSYNNNPTYEPKGRSAADNGYNDIGKIRL